MAKFKVKLQRCLNAGRNPFYPVAMGIGDKVRMSIREWEFEAKDEMGGALSLPFERLVGALNLKPQEVSNGRER